MTALGTWGARSRFWVAIVCVAVLAGGFATVFRAGLSFVWTHAAGTRDVVDAMRRAPWWIRLPAPAVGALAGGVLARVAARTPASEGVGAVMEAVVFGRDRMSMRVTWLKSAASWLAIVSGGSLGREGPLIQFGGGAGKWVSGVLGIPAHRTRLIAAGTAAGFAAAYNTPFAAALFVLEVVTGVIVIEDLVPVLLATAIASALTRMAVGAGPLYGQRAFVLHSQWELVAFAGLALVAAVVSQGFMHSLQMAERLFAPLRLPWRAALGGALTGAVVMVLPEVAGNGYEPLQALLDGQLALGFVTVLLLGKIVATSASVSSGSPGGVFTPTLLVGGATGYVYGALLQSAGIPVGPAGGYALVGMAAATAATTHAPLMAAVMAFELSGDYAIALPLLVPTAIAVTASRGMAAKSIYAAELEKRGIEWQEPSRAMKPLNGGD